MMPAARLTPDRPGTARPLTPARGDVPAIDDRPRPVSDPPRPTYASNSRCSRSNSPALVRQRNLRQQVIPRAVTQLSGKVLPTDTGCRA